MTIVLLLTFVAFVMCLGYVLGEPSELPSEIQDWSMQTSDVTPIGNLASMPTFGTDPTPVALSALGSTHSKTNTDFYLDADEFEGEVAGSSV